MKKVKMTLVLLMVSSMATYAQTAKTQFDYTRLKGSMTPVKTDYSGKKLKIQYNTPVVKDKFASPINNLFSAPITKCYNWDVVKKDAACDILVVINADGITNQTTRFDSSKMGVFITFQYYYPTRYQFIDAANNTVLNEVVVAQPNEIFLQTTQNNFPEKVENFGKDLIIKNDASEPFTSIAAAKKYWDIYGQRILAQSERETATEMGKRLFKNYLKDYGASFGMVDVFYQKPNLKKTDIDLKDLPQIVALVKEGCDSIEAAKGRNANFVSIFKRATDYYENMVATNDPRMVDEIPQLVYWNGCVCYLFQQEYQKAGQWFHKYEKALGKSAAFREEMTWETINQFVSGEYKD